MDKFNEGVLTSESIDRQFTPEKVLDMVVEFPKRKRPYTSTASTYTMPKHAGDTATVEVRYPAIHEDSISAANVDATSALLVQGVFYKYDADGILTDQKKAIDFLRDASGATRTYAEASAAAKAALGAPAAGGVIKSSAGSIVNGKGVFQAFTGDVANLPEEGGMVNGIMGVSKLVSAKVVDKGVHQRYTVKSIDLDSRVGQIARKIADTGDALALIKEQYVQGKLLNAANTNMMISTTDAAIVSVDEIDGADRLTYESLEAYGLALMNADVPMDTEIIKGTDLTDTVTVSDAYIMDVNREVVPTLTRLVGPGGNLPWEPKEKYAAGTELIEGEVGKITGLPFRFRVVDDLQVNRGAGEEVGGASDAGTAPQQAGSYVTSNQDGSKKFYDVFTGLVVGSDSWTMVGFGKNSTTAKHNAPIGDSHNDPFGRVGSIAAECSIGVLVYRPERIMSIKFSLGKTGV